MTRPTKGMPDGSATRGNAAAGSASGFNPFNQWPDNITNSNPACSAKTSHALAGRGRGIILPDLPASPLYDAVVLSLAHPESLFGSLVETRKK